MLSSRPLSSTAAISLLVTRSHRRHVHSISATNDIGSSPVPCTLASSPTAAAWRVLELHPHGDANSRRHSS